MPLDKIEFFGSPDRQGKTGGGKVSSEYPAWYFDNKINESMNGCSASLHILKFSFEFGGIAGRGVQ